MHHLKNTEHEKATEKLTTAGRKQRNTFIKDKIEKDRWIVASQNNILQAVTLVRVISIEMQATAFMTKLCSFCN